ncbi:MAG: hypothetical protein GTN80_06220 [Nitrososphaeria archaeon]|nr:hypothetical protein [Nitrososphaeria archaeon]NIN52744.1 hypothetical protein [Nitrososphaeria archaeon]NIQ33221.1 hypothetical protein [Nitrososphaeria archaeon]
MVEVWLPYGDTEVPILIPEPVDIEEIKGRTLLDIKIEEMIKDQFTQLDLTPEQGQKLRMVIEPEATAKQKELLEKIFFTAEVSWEEVRFGQESNKESFKKPIKDAHLPLTLDHDPCSENLVFVGIFRPSLVFGFTGFLTSLYKLLARKSRMEILKESIELETGYGKENELHKDFAKVVDENKLRCLSLVVDSTDRVVGVFSGRDSRPWRLSKELYMDLWESDARLKASVIASSGGMIWDNHFIDSLRGLYNVVLNGEDKQRIIYLTDSSAGLEADSTLFWSALKRGRYRSVSTASIVKIRNLLREKRPRITLLSSIPHALTNALRIRRIGSSDRALSAIPARERREVSLVINACETLFSR